MASSDWFSCFKDPSDPDTQPLLEDENLQQEVANAQQEVANAQQEVANAQLGGASVQLVDARSKVTDMQSEQRIANDEVNNSYFGRFLEL